MHSYILEGSIRNRFELLRQAILTASTPGKLVSFHEFIELREQEKITGDCLSTVMLFLTRSSRILYALCAGALSWWSSH